MFNVETSVRPAVWRQIAVFPYRSQRRRAARPDDAFQLGEIFDFALAPDGKSAVVARGSTSSDVVVFRNSK